MGKDGLSKSPNPRAIDAQYKNPESLKLFWLTRFLDALKKVLSSPLSPIITSTSLGRLREVKDEEEQSIYTCQVSLPVDPLFHVITELEKFKRFRRLLSETKLMAFFLSFLCVLEYTLIAILHYVIMLVS